MRDARLKRNARFACFARIERNGRYALVMRAMYAMRVVCVMRVLPLLRVMDVMRAMCAMRVKRVLRVMRVYPYESRTSQRCLTGRKRKSHCRVPIVPMEMKVDRQITAKRKYKV